MTAQAFRRSTAIGAALLALACGMGGAEAAEGAAPLPHRNWSFEGIFGTFDRGALQRGFQVYRESCAACHSMKLLAYRNLRDIGFSEDQVKEIAASFQINDGPNDQGEMFERPGRPGDRFRSPFANDNAARAANNGAYPPDFSVISKSRLGGATYIYALLIGYKDAPAGMQMQQGMNYNAYFPGHQIAMPPPLQPGAVSYADGTEATLERMSADVATFLAWASEPELESRKRMGVKVLLFLFVLTGMLYAVKRKVWAGVAH